MPRRASTVGSLAQGNHQQPNRNPSEKKKRTTRPAGCPDPSAEVVALRPEDLLATGRYICTVCSKGFQRDQNLQLHMRTHNINYELKKSGRTPVRRKAYVCPIPSCVYSHSSRALSDITGIKKHFNRKHGPKNLKCPHCTKTYAVEADLKAHIKNHSLHQYRCKCSDTFSRKNSYEAHIALCSEPSEEGDNVPNLMDAGESSNARYAFNENSGLPDMNEQVEYPVDVANDEVAPLGEATMAEQHPSVSLPTMANYNPDVPDTREQMNNFLSLLPDDPDLLAMRLTDLLNGPYDEIFGGVVGGTAPSPLSGASHSVLPTPASSLDGLRVENGSAIDFCLGSSFSLMNSTEKSAGFGSTNRSLTNMCLYGTGEKASVQANSTAKNDFLDNTSASLTETGQKSNPSTAIPMLGSLSFMNNNTSQQFQAPVLSGSSSGSTLLQKAGLINSTAIAPLPSYFSGLVMKTPTNLFQTQQQEHMLPPAPEPSFLTSLPNLKPVPGNINSFSHHTQENDHSNLSRSAFSIYRPEYGNISSNNSPVTSYFRNFADSTDSYSWQKGKAPAGFVNYFPDSTMASGNFPTGNPIQSLVNPYPLSGNIGPSSGRMMEIGGQSMMKPAETVSLPPRPMARSAVMRQNEEVFDDGVTMNLLRLQEEGGGQFHQAEGANTTFPANADNEEQMAFFGGVNGCPKHFW
ncbi:hypothetical protein ZIOFF_000276 [Zingiber officinale]|uniref:C2H2-type domain-containing protein n=1 Tax=Zingiber officinale TaxID=94328 RepID=A0A8J5I005_ZINOF|nr:hypothetical protein ZIOFF_000276 [Zingiber officinale]